jgi:hypothetical protein
LIERQTQPLETLPPEAFGDSGLPAEHRVQDAGRTTRFCRDPTHGQRFWAVPFE